MYSLKEFMRALESFAPLSLSYKMIENGAYDNSGPIVYNHDKIDKVLFSLDLSAAVVKQAENLGCDTIVTHHPAIYTPIKTLEENGQNAAVLQAIRKGFNVISMHLNLDVAEKGIDENLSRAIGGVNTQIISPVTENTGYGRETQIEQTTIENFLQGLIKTFCSDKIIAYGTGKVEKVASFCGAGGSDALCAVQSGLTDVDTIITSDLQHHVLKELIEKDKNVVIIPHYVAENKGFEKFYEYVAQSSAIKAYYFVDKRFM